MLVLAMFVADRRGQAECDFRDGGAETAIPPYAQKRIVHELRKLSAQSMFTSHSPYVLEEFAWLRRSSLTFRGRSALTQASIALPDSVKHEAVSAGVPNAFL